MIKKEDVRGLIEERSGDKVLLEALWELYERLVRDESRKLNKEPTNISIKQQQEAS